MDDVIDFAIKRHGELAEAIKKLEAEIERFEEEKSALETFVSTAKSLAERAAADKSKSSIQSENGTSQKMPVRQLKSV